MCEAIAPMPRPDWRAELPPGFDGQVVAPVRFEAHVDEAAHARTVVGVDREGRRCFVQRAHTLTEERFDIDEFPLEIAVQRERRIAWRLASGRWLRVVDRLDRLDSCRPRRQRQGPELVDTAQAVA